MMETQPSTLLSTLIAQFEPDQRLSVLHIGSALPETVEFFSQFRSKLYFVDLFSELPIAVDEEASLSLQYQFSRLMDFAPTTRFDLCLFWDLFNFLDGEAITAMLKVLRPHLSADTVAHGFGAYNIKSPQGGQLYGITPMGELNVRARERQLPAYRPHPQGKLKTLLNCFNIDRSVLLSDSRLELLMSVRSG